jgi:putative copper export protein
MFESLNVAALFAATTLTIGACTAMWLLQPTVGVPAERADPDAVFRRIEAAAVAGALALCVLLAGRLVTHAVAVFGLPSALTLESLRIVGLQSRWGGGWRAQVIVAAASLACAVWHRRTRSRWSRIAISVSAAAFAFTLPMSGHSAGSGGHIIVAGVHVLGGGAWIGTLAILLITAGPSRDRGHSPSSQAAMFQRFSPLAMVGVATVVTTGLVLAWLYVEAPLTILNNGYGRLLVAKLALFAGVAGSGFLNWRRARNGEPLAAATWEVALAAVLVVVTGFLTETSPP